MIWVYRVFRDQDEYCVRVVLYERDGVLMGYHKDPAVPSGRTTEELVQDLESFTEAFKLPILTIDELEEELSQRSKKPKNTQRKTIEEIESEMLEDKILLDSSTQKEIKVSV
jgi:hypothetical protein